MHEIVFERHMFPIYIKKNESQKMKRQTERHQSSFVDVDFCKKKKFYLLFLSFAIFNVFLPMAVIV